MRTPPWMASRKKDVGHEMRLWSYHQTKKEAHEKAGKGGIIMRTSTHNRIIREGHEDNPLATMGIEMKGGVSEIILIV